MVTVEVPARPYTAPPFGSVSVIGRPLCTMTIPATDQPSASRRPVLPARTRSGSW